MPKGANLHNTFTLIVSPLPFLLYREPKDPHPLPITPAHIAAAKGVAKYLDVVAFLSTLADHDESGPLIDIEVATREGAAAGAAAHAARTSVSAASSSGITTSTAARSSDGCVSASTFLDMNAAFMSLGLVCIHEDDASLALDELLACGLISVASHSIAARRLSPPEEEDGDDGEDVEDEDVDDGGEYDDDEGILTEDNDDADDGDFDDDELGEEIAAIGDALDGMDEHDVAMIDAMATAAMAASHGALFNPSGVDIDEEADAVEVDGASTGMGGSAMPLVGPAAAAAASPTPTLPLVPPPIGSYSADASAAPGPS